MKWKKFTLTTTTEAEDLVVSMLADLGIEGVEIEDLVPLTERDTKGMFIDILPKLPPDEGRARIHFYLEEDADAGAWLERVRDGLKELADFVDLGEQRIVCSETEDKDWIDNWKQYFKPFTVDDILIKPTWEAVPEEHKDKLQIQIDPGTAFGTGKHETTQLCIRQLKKYVKPGMSLLDVGTGSGILGLVRCKLGIDHVLGTDLDPCAVSAVRENMQANHVPEGQFELIIGNIITDSQVQKQAGREQYDLVTANILADVLVPLSPVAVRYLKPGGLYITSGILDQKEEEVRQAVEQAGMKVIETTRQGEWVSLTAKKE